MFAGLDLYCVNPAQPPTTAGEELDPLDDDLSVDRYIHHLSRGEEFIQYVP